MVTYFLGREEVSAYLRDFLERLNDVKPTPSVWCPMTPSGNVLLEQFLDLISSRKSNEYDDISVLPIEVASNSERLRFKSKSPEQEIKGKSVLLFDSSIHSGSTITKAVEKLIELGAKQVCTYSLVVKKGSGFIPTMWGLMINESDRAFFLLDKIPNHRLRTSSQINSQPVHIQRLGNGDLKKPLVKSNLKSIDRVTWADRYFDMVTTEEARCSYLLKGRNQIMGYLTVHRGKKNTLVVDELAVDQRYRGKKWGGVLMRFADTLARQSDCEFLKLYAIEDQVKFYKHHNFSLLTKKPLQLDGESYFPMQKPLLAQANLY
jgi:N-acetylglutamate synthase-like GNAT family acetyltransferase